MKPFSFTGLTTDFLSLFYPSVCAACSHDLRKGESVLCIRCRYQLPRTGYMLQSGHTLERLFHGRAKLIGATALFHYIKGSGVQRLVHHLKYNGRKDVGTFAGKMLAERWSEFPEALQPHVVIPVPLYHMKMKQRGFNQAEEVSGGFASVMNISHLPDALIRIQESGTQTLRHRYERFTSMDGIFKLKRKEELAGKKVLLVDDVITTGATLISCAEALADVPNIELMIGAIAVARR